jgi:hypothetical protein
MASRNTNNKSGTDEVREAMEVCERLLALSPSTLRIVCEHLIQRDRFLQATWGDYGLVRHIDYFDHGFGDLDTNQVSDMKYLPDLFRRLRQAEANSDRAVVEERLETVTGSSGART